MDEKIIDGAIAQTDDNAKSLACGDCHWFAEGGGHCVRYPPFFTGKWNKGTPICAHPAVPYGCKACGEFKSK